MDNLQMYKELLADKYF